MLCVCVSVYVMSVMPCTLAEGDKGEINGRGGRAATGRRQCGVIKPAPLLIRRGAVA